MRCEAWIMLAFAVLVLGGGLFVCIRHAIRVDRRKRQEGIVYDPEADD
jgi:hypothetical protein